MLNTLAIVMAGGVGERLYPLTRSMAKPAVPFGGIYRIIDFTLSNCLNSDLRKILILTQYKALQLNRHIRQGWDIFSKEIGEYIEVIPPMKRVHSDWYLGTADAVFQNIQSIEVESPKHVLILGGDHIYKMNYHEMLEWHERHNADVTVGTIQVPPEEACRFGVAQINEEYRIVGFEEKPKHGNPTRSSFNRRMVSASMGIYLFKREVLLELLREDARCAGSTHDFGHDVLPGSLSSTRAIAFDFRDLNDKTARYWRDVGTLDAYYDANMDLVSVVPEFNLYDRRWPIRTRMEQAPPAKFVFAQEGRRMGVAIDSTIANGCIVSGGRVVSSVLSPNVRINSYCEVVSSILLNDVNIGRYSRVRRAIIDAGVTLPEGSVVGYDLDEDRAKGYHVTENGVVVVPNEAEMS
jgi:glucose-1-phosphate adenylyltransferase